MALGNRNFVSTASGSSGMARAKKLADLYIKNNTNEAGDVTDPNVYTYVIDNILAPYADDIDVQNKIAGYQNRIKDLTTQVFEQDSTLGAFQQDVDNALFSKSEVSRDPAQMAYFSATALDNIVFGLDNAIAYFEESNKSADRLISYRREVMELADAQRDLVNNLQNGTLPQNLDGYGYFVKTNPLDGSLVGAAILPVNSAPSQLTDNMKRIENTVGLGEGGSKLPVYLPVTQNSQGDYEARLYNNVWTGYGTDPILAAKETPAFIDGGFDLRNPSLFPIKNTNLSPGGFGRVVSGVKDGQTQFTYYYRGNDNQVRLVDQASLDAFKQDPIMANRINGYIPLLSPDEVSGLGSVQTVNPAEVVRNVRIQTMDAAIADAPQDRETKFDQLKYKAGQAIEEVGGFFKNVFNRKNRQNKPEEAVQSTSNGYSTPDVVDTGKGFFRNRVA